MNSNFSIINTVMTVQSMRSSGYKSTTHALAELIDNSIESGASSIEIFGVSRFNEQTNRYTLAELAVLDNGEGMNPTNLRRSLRYGDGTRAERQGIGRFGLGLPNSSMSQARRVDIWSWQTGITNAVRTWLSIDDVQDGIAEIPEPKLQAIPEVYIQCSREEFSESGTLVVWSELDRVEWRKAATTFRHIQGLLGRIYRRFICDSDDRLHPDDPRTDDIDFKCAITCIPIEENNGEFSVEETDIVAIQANDPLYLMNNTQCLEEFGSGPMFKELQSPFSIPINYKGQEYSVRLRASYAQAHVRDSTNENASWPEEWQNRDAGHTPWGKDADRNLGVSIMRAHREIELDISWVNKSDPKERWWTVEIDFPTELDEVFGISNNKQSAATFQRMSNFDFRREAESSEETIADIRKRMESDGDYRVQLFELRRQIEKSISVMRNKIDQTKKPRKSRHEEPTEEQYADAQATAVIKRRSSEGSRGDSDQFGDTGTPDEHKEQQLTSLVDSHNYDDDVAIQEIEETLRTRSRVRWIQSSQSSPAFFNVESLPNLIQVALNTQHPVFERLYEVMHADTNELSEDELKLRLNEVSAAFRILIYSWARYEDEQVDRDKRPVRNARIEWGKYAEEFFDTGDDSIQPTDLV